MKDYLVIILPLLFILSCNQADAPDCFQSRGNEVTKILELPDFSSIEVNQEFQVIIEQSSVQEISLTAGENLLSDISLEVIDNQLIISNANSCNWVRAYEWPKVYIKHPNISSIRQNGGGVVSSTNTLNYPELSLISEASTGDFLLDITSNRLSIENNDVSNYKITGSTDELFIGFYAGDGRFEGENLIARNVDVFHRGTNDIIVNASNYLKGRILSTGDLILVGNKPAVIDVSDENRGSFINNTTN